MEEVLALEEAPLHGLTLAGGGVDYPGAGIQEQGEQYYPVRLRLHIGQRQYVKMNSESLETRLM
jgi:hypothetical protein